jgi:hypothetical protein
MNWDLKKDCGGIFNVLNNAFKKSQLINPNFFPDLQTCEDIVIVADFTTTRNHDVMSFLIIDPYSLANWDQLRLLTRFNFKLQQREIGYKKLNDKIRRLCLTTFINNVNQLHGGLLTILIDKSMGCLFPSIHSEGSEDAILLVNNFKSSILERVLRVTNFCAVLFAGLCGKTKKITWIMDEDDIVANDFKRNIFFKTLVNSFFEVTNGKKIQFNMFTPNMVSSEIPTNITHVKDLLAIPDLMVASSFRV